jgi:DNA polymerase-3 subunit gamma/tau
VGAPATESSGLDTAALRRVWPDVLARIFTMRRVTWTFLSQHAQIVDYDGHRLVLGIATVGLANTFRAGNHAELVRQALIDEIGVDVPVEGVPMPDAGSDRRPGPGPGDPRSAPPRAPEPDPWPEPEAEPWTQSGAPPDFVPPPGRSAAPPETPSSPVSSSPEPTTPAARRRPSRASQRPPASPRASDGATANGSAGRGEPGARGGHDDRSGSPDDAVSDDDENIAPSSSDGRAVVERVLGGQFLGELED